MWTSNAFGYVVLKRRERRRELASIAVINQSMRRCLYNTSSLERLINCERLKISRNLINVLIRALFECYQKTYLEKFTRGQGEAFTRQRNLNLFFRRKTGHWSIFEPAAPEELIEPEITFRWNRKNAPFSTVNRESVKIHNSEVFFGRNQLKLRYYFWSLLILFLSASLK